MRFAETREARAIKELLGGGGGAGRTPLGEKYVNRMVSATGAPTSLSMEEAKLLASLRKLDAHCLAIPAAAAGLDFRGGGMIGGYDHVSSSRTVDSLVDGVSTSGAYSSRRSVEEAALLASLKRLDGRLGGMKEQMVAIGQLALQAGDGAVNAMGGRGAGGGGGGGGGGEDFGFLGPPPPALIHHPPGPQRQPRTVHQVTDAWGAPPAKEGSGGVGGGAPGGGRSHYGGSGVTSVMKKRHERKQVGHVRPAVVDPSSVGGGVVGVIDSTTAASPYGRKPLPTSKHHQNTSSAALTPTRPTTAAAFGGGLRSAVAAAAGGGGGGEVLRARQHVRDSGGTISGNIHDYF